MQSNDKDSEDGWLASIEEGYLASMAAEPDYECEYVTEREASMSGMWGNFQESATSIAQLYRDRLNSNETGALWIPFQTAAGTVTTLYKESSDSLKRTNEKAIHCGYQRRTREMTEWVRKKNRRYIRKEELLAYLAGKPAPPLHSPKGYSPHHHNHHPHHHPHSIHHGPSVTLGNIRHSNLGSGAGGGVAPSSLLGVGHHNSSHHLHHLSHLHHRSSTDLEDGVGMHTFKEALAKRPRTPELYAFVADEIARNCKRPGSPLDINMDVPSLASKRQRFL